MKTFLLPDLGEGLAEAEIHEWFVKEGDEIKIDQLMVSVETAKAVVDVPSPRSGTIAKLHGKRGDIIKVGEPLVEFTDGEDKPQKSSDKGTVAGKIVVGDTILEEEPMGVTTQQSTGSARIKAIPAVRALAKQLNVDLTTINGTGAQQQITLEDVKRASKQTTGTLLTDAEPLHGVRRTMAQTMAKAHDEIVSVTIVDDADLHNWAPDTDITLRIIRSIIRACQTETALNAWYDGTQMARQLHSNINLGLAVDSTEGLFVPVIKNAQELSPLELRNQINQLKEQTKNRTLPPERFKEATITLSNFGNFAGRYANPVVVPPTVAIIGAGRIRDEVVAVNGSMEIHRILPISLTFDHRAATGGEATRFLATMLKDLQLSH